MTNSLVTEFALNSVKNLGKTPLGPVLSCLQSNLHDFVQRHYAGYFICPDCGQEHEQEIRFSCNEPKK